MSSPNLPPLALAWQIRQPRGPAGTLLDPKKSSPSTLPRPQSARAGRNVRVDFRSLQQGWNRLQRPSRGRNSAQVPKVRSWPILRIRERPLLSIADAGKTVTGSPLNAPSSSFARDAPPSLATLRHSRDVSVPAFARATRHSVGRRRSLAHRASLVYLPRPRRFAFHASLQCDSPMCGRSRSVTRHSVSFPTSAALTLRPLNQRLDSCFTSSPIPRKWTNGSASSLLIACLLTAPARSGWRVPDRR